MSGGISNRFVDFAVFSFDIDRVRYGSFTMFLVRNWCVKEMTAATVQPSQQQPAPPEGTKPNHLPAKLPPLQ